MSISCPHCTRAVSTEEPWSRRGFCSLACSLEHDGKIRAAGGYEVFARDEYIAELKRKINDLQSRLQKGAA